ncbi:BlaI/MecI/CopY family transcriptional regulator [Chitinophaga sedimenti]|uniref:BlaI/MecI/CopY family transcriptional regulator n=1 Tax=Chitinophaga sedimenti TaxID=2033606 RepID=UPI002003C177|nr:BlaI/MecI/CopY family transcriptional regulator [Chitinophaga sedimenti]MCK7554801.1 BlaI/MecI/CopY family transcriptional regulator [Chitinophaga sedimenti]
MKEDVQGNQQAEPSRGELEILQLLWKHGPSTVRFVNDQLNAERNVIYTSTLKTMQIMTDKGMLARDETSMKHVYRPLLEEQSTKGLLLNKFLESTFNGSATTLLQQLLGNGNTSRGELQQIKSLLDKLENEQP